MSFLGDYKDNYEEIYFNEETNYSKIYNAFNTKNNVDCILKVINKKELELGDYDFLMEQIKREEEITKLCKSEYTIELYNKFETEENIIFEYENYENNLGDNSFNELKENIELFKDIVLSLVNALKIIHKKGVMHRDIKPNNIFIKNLNDEKKIIKLGDFSCSIYIKDNTFDPIGTILYTAPEIIKNLKYDEKCDLWSLGVTLYQLYFGESPYGNNISKNQILKTIYDEKNFKLKNSNIPTLDILFRRLLVINPKERMSYDELFKYFSNDNFLKNDVIYVNDNSLYKKLYEIIKNEIQTEEEEEYIPEGLNTEKMEKESVQKVLTFLEGDDAPDIICAQYDGKINNIIYYDENPDHFNAIKLDCEYYEKNTPGAFILCTSLESLKILKDEILKQNKNDKKCLFNLITTGRTFEKVMKFLDKNEDFKKIILNACIYCLNIKKYLPFKEKYNIIHDDIYNKQSKVVNFIKTHSSDKIKPFPIKKLITYEDYKNKYKERHFEISQFYGDLNKNNYERYKDELKSLIEKHSNGKKVDENTIKNFFEAYSKFDLTKEVDEMNNLIIKEYTKHTFHRELNRYLNDPKKIYLGIMIYITSRFMYTLNDYATRKKKFCYEKKEFYRGIPLSYSCVLQYERVKGEIIVLPAFTSTSESKKLAEIYSNREFISEAFETNLKFSVIFTITNIYKENWISSGINIQEVAKYKKEKEYVFQPFTFYYVRDVQIDIKNHIADIFLETVGKTEILEEKIKEGKEVEYNKKENIIQIKN